jgi:hypothetical protein
VNLLTIEGVGKNFGGLQALTVGLKYGAKFDEEREFSVRLELYRQTAEGTPSAVPRARRCVKGSLSNQVGRLTLLTGMVSPRMAARPDAISRTP